MKKTIQLGLLFVGALALSFTLATAEGKCASSNDKKEMKCAAGKCGSDDAKKAMKCAAGKCGNSTKETKKVPSKGKCGQGKCG